MERRSGVRLKKKKEKRGRREKNGDYLLDSRGVSFRVRPRQEKKKRENKIVRFEEKENELKKGESRKLITKKKKSN